MNEEKNHPPLFMGHNSYHCPESLLDVRLDLCDPGVWRFMQPLNVMQPLLEFFLQNLAKPNMFLKLGPNFEATVFSRLWSYVVDAGTKQNPYCWCQNKTKTMSLCKNKTILKQYIICHDFKAKVWSRFEVEFCSSLRNSAIGRLSCRRSF